MKLVADRRSVPDERQTLYNTFIDYEQSEQLDINNVGDGKVMQKIAAESFEITKRTMGDVLTDQSFNVPEYQRLYSWEEKHHKQFWSDLRQFIDADLVAGQENVSDVFFSSMYFAVNDDNDVYEVIDGQQRLTTTHIILRVIREHLDAIAADAISDGTITDLRTYGIDRIDNLLYQLASYAGYDTRLTLNKHDAEFFEALISGPKAQVAYLCSDDRTYVDGRRGDAMRVSDYLDRFAISDDQLDDLETDGLRRSRFLQLYDSHRMLLDAYGFYRDRISGVVDDADRPDEAVLALLNISHYLQHSYHIGEYVIREAEPDFRMQIFEILNDRGVDLTKIDRIRAAVVNAFFDTEYKDAYIEKWENIVSAFAADDTRIDDYLSIYLSIVDESVDTIGEASAQLTNAFDTRTIESDVKPRLRDLRDARTFIDHARELVPYYRAIINPNLDASELELADYRTQCQEILVRLNDQQMDQWQPFVLALYYHTDPTSSSDAARFYEVLDTIEKLNFRRLLVSERPNIFREVFIDAVHEFGLSPAGDSEVADPYAEANAYLIDEMRSSTPSLFGDRFLDTISQAQSWNPGSAKLLFGKIAHRAFRDEGEIVDRRLNMGSIHLEHVFPKSPVYDAKNPVWLREFFQLETADTELADQISAYIDLVQRDDLDEEEAQLKESISEFITQRFVNDIGNFLLLRDGDNISASNRPLAQKMPQYYNNVDDFTSIYPNRYFTPDAGEIDAEELERLQEQYTAVKRGERDSIDEDLRAYFNSVWTYEAMKDRRVGLLEDILDVVGFDALPDEFGLESDPDGVIGELREKTDQEFEKRLSVRSL